MIAITGVSLTAGGSASEHITQVAWLDTERGTALRATVPQMVTYAENGNALYVGGKDGWNEVRVVRPAGQAPYLRSVKDNTYTDNLLFLPRF
jgi:1-aminocyclopropane-1-carboxylate deaminase/D-cysteine desulfhydrase-like pyridoxal-dependent ACC family enzyme